MGRVAESLAVVLLLASSGAAKRVRESRLPDSVTVKPSEEIEIRVSEEVQKAESILNQLDWGNLFDSPYLASAVYYHDGFLGTYPSDRPDLDPSGRIVAKISRLLSPERKPEYIGLLRNLWEDRRAPSGSQQLFLPVPDAETGKRRRRRQPHRYAVDLFVPEGTPVRSVAPGLVILADGDWRDGDPFSTSSLRGGNSVIVFSPDNARFYRYCHLDEVLISAGMAVDAGQQIGSVGHTGFNASRKGHGRHLHFEVNEFDGRIVRALDKNQLLALLRQIATENQEPSAAARTNFGPLTSKTAKPRH